MIFAKSKCLRSSNRFYQASSPKRDTKLKVSNFSHI